MSNTAVLQADGYDHAHGHVRVRGGTLGLFAILVLTRLRLPTGWFIDAGADPHDPECTSTVGVVR